MTDPKSNPTAIGQPSGEPSADAISGFYSGMARFWQPVLRSEDLPADRPVSVDLLGRPLVLARLDGTVSAMLDACRHYQARLSLGEIIEHQGHQALMCPYHGWAYAGSGQCVRIPQLPEGRKIPPAAGVPAFKTVEHLGLIWVCLADEPEFELVGFPEFDDAAFRVVSLREAEPMRASSVRMIMGTLDDTHFPWVHEGILGTRGKPEPPDHRVWRDADGRTLVVEYEVMQPASLLTTDPGKIDGAAGNGVAITYTDYVGMPNVIRLVKDGPSGRYVVWLATCPNDYRTTTNFWYFARNYDLDPARDAEYESVSAHVRSQDKPIIESQRPWLLPPFWTQIELPVRPGDAPLIEYQKWLQELQVATAI
jgi:vanillate O-demethylase monooxygenase subunit